MNGTQTPLFNELAVHWVSWVKNHQNVIFIVNLIYVKAQFNHFDFLFCKIIWLGEPLVLIPFFDNFNFWNSLLMKLCLIFVNSWSSPIKKVSADLIFWAKIYIWFRLCNNDLQHSTVRSYYCGYMLWVKEDSSRPSIGTLSHMLNDRLCGHDELTYVCAT